MHRQLKRLAEERRQSLRELVREACERQYGLADRDAGLAAVATLATMRLPVGPVEQMIAESVPEARDQRGGQTALAARRPRK
jgi:hypothetical protein